MKSVYDRKDGNLVSERKVIIEGSGKHCHVTRETLDILFGEGFELEIKRWLTQPGQYSTPHKVKIVGPRKSADLTIIGPPRKADQIELSLTDARAMGISAPIRESGDLAGSPGIKLIGPKGEVDIEEGVIIAKRHVHFTPEDAEKFGVKDKQIIMIKVEGARPLIYDDVVARVHKDYATYMHLDYDELNAAALPGTGHMGIIID